MFKKIDFDTVHTFVDESQRLKGFNGPYSREEPEGITFDEGNYDYKEMMKLLDAGKIKIVYHDDKGNICDRETHLKLIEPFFDKYRPIVEQERLDATKTPEEK